MTLQPQAGAGRSYIFQPSQPVQQLSFPGPVVSGGAANIAVQYKLYPTDTSLFPSVNGGSYWTSAVSAAFLQSDAAAAVTAITAALNTIPVITFAYPGYFVADSNVVGLATGSSFTILVAFPDFLTGSIAMSTKVQLSTVTDFTAASVPWLGAGYVAALGDNVNGNREAVTCSNRGICDFASGLCSCFAGQTGEDCSQQNALARGSQQNALARGSSSGGK